MKSSYYYAQHKALMTLLIAFLSCITMSPVACLKLLSIDRGLGKSGLHRLLVTNITIRV